MLLYIDYKAFKNETNISDRLELMLELINMEGSITRIYSRIFTVELPKYWGIFFQL